MSKNEYLWEHDEWSPRITLLPHHFTIPNVQKMLMRIRKPADEASKVATSYGYQKKSDTKDFLYWRDVIGKTDGHRNIYRKRLRRAYSEIYSLNDTDVIHFDLAKDVICRSCIVGNHCLATNYRTHEDPFDTYKSEIDELKHIATALDNHGYQYGIDYIHKKTRHILRDYLGQELGTLIQSKPEYVEFRSILAKVGPLRVITETFLREEAEKSKQ